MALLEPGLCVRKIKLASDNRDYGVGLDARDVVLNVLEGLLKRL